MTAETLRLPTLPGAYLTLHRKIADHRSSLDSIADTVGADPALAARALRMANHGHFGSRYKQISTVRDAVRVLGLRRVLDLALAASVMRLFKTPQCLGHFWDNAVQRAAWSGALAQAMGWNSDEAQLAGLLADIGVLVLAANTPGQDAFDWSSAPDPAVEVASFGVDRGRAGSELLFHWGLPAELVHPAEFHRSPTGGAHQTWTVPFVAAATALVDGADPDLAMTLAGLPNGLALKARESQLARLDGLHHVLR